MGPNFICADRTLRTRGAWALEHVSRSRWFTALGLGLTVISCGPEQTVRVTATADGQNGSLRSAIGTANARKQADFRIEIPTGTYELNLCGADDTNDAGDLDITTLANVTIIATGPDVVIRQTCAGERVLDDHGTGLLRLIGVTITGGSLVSSGARGGGVRALGDVTLAQTTVTGNSATAILDNGGAEPSPGAAYGGGLFIAGALNATDSTISNNAVRAADSTAAVAPGGAAEGGGAYVGRAIRLTNGSITGNQAVGGHGTSASLADGGGSAGGAARGGGVAQSSTSIHLVRLQGITLNNNTAQAGNAGGMPDGWDPFNPPTGLAPGGTAAGGALAMGGGALLADDLTVSGNRALGGSSGLGVCFQSCAAPAPAGEAMGGAFASGGSANIRKSTFSMNTAQSGNTHAGRFGFAQIPFGVAAASAAGGAIYSRASLVTTESTYSQNAVTMGVGLEASGKLARGGAVASDANVGTFDCTFAQNMATGSLSSGRGGAIEGGQLVLGSSTFNGNQATGDGGAAHGSNLDARSVIASGNKGGGAGGGAFAIEGGARVVQSRIDENSVEARFEDINHPLLAGGGGLRVTGQLTLVNTLVFHNTGRSEGRYQTGFIPLMFEGGGVYAGSMRGENVTIANNSAIGLSPSDSFPIALPGSTGGGAIASSGTVSLVNATLMNNDVSAPAGVPSSFVIINVGAAVLAPRLELEQATIAQNTGAPTLQVTELETFRSAAIAPPPNPNVTPPQWPVCSAGVTTAQGSLGNWYSDASCGLPENEINHESDAEFLLTPLADNGGPVLTSLPERGSVLIDQIPRELCPTRTDARGVIRPQGPRCDIGAVEQ